MPTSARYNKVTAGYDLRRCLTCSSFWIRLEAILVVHEREVREGIARRFLAAPLMASVR
jgi:hypothetical protein